MNKSVLLIEWLEEQGYEPKILLPIKAIIRATSQNNPDTPDQFDLEIEEDAVVICKDDAAITKISLFIPNSFELIKEAISYCLENPGCDECPSKNSPFVQIKGDPNI
jgi:hypothetical protein